MLVVTFESLTIRMYSERGDSNMEFLSNGLPIMIHDA